jgi:hypothetical protein
MTTTIAYTLTVFSSAVVLLAALGWLLLRRRREARRTAVRIGVTFAVFALAAGYVWLELGPDLDQQLQARGRPHLPDQAARELDV